MFSIRAYLCKVFASIFCTSIIIHKLLFFVIKIHVIEFIPNQFITAGYVSCLLGDIYPSLLSLNTRTKYSEHTCLPASLLTVTVDSMLTPPLEESDAAESAVFWHVWTCPAVIFWYTRAETATPNSSDKTRTATPMYGLLPVLLTGSSSLYKSKVNHEHN